MEALRKGLQIFQARFAKSLFLNPGQMSSHLGEKVLHILSLIYSNVYSN